VTSNSTRTPGTGLPNTSRTVATTQCCSPAVFSAVAGDTSTVAGAAGPYVFSATPVGSVASNWPSSFALAIARIVSVPATVPV
jgi:hypothetical protein